MSTSFAHSDMSFGATKYMFHHVFFPPKLPQENDYNPEFELTLLGSVIHALGRFKTYATEQEDRIIASVIEMVARLKSQAGFNGDVNEGILLQNLQKLTQHGKLLQENYPTNILI